ncbi:hypothetical protein KM043_007057 [Ampulex compressa]|nr:hypothetical protein KM043_007057 [Ampulex compressa]
MRLANRFAEYPEPEGASSRVEPRQVCEKISGRGPARLHPVPAAAYAPIPTIGRATVCAIRECCGDEARWCLVPGGMRG